MSGIFADDLLRYDASGVTREHWKIMFISGMGFFTEFDPNTTTFVYPAELFPVDGRTTSRGIASAAGKIGAFAGVFTFPLLMAWHSLLAVEMGAAIASLLGLIVTVVMLPETKNHSLEDLSNAPDVAREPEPIAIRA